MGMALTTVFGDRIPIIIHTLAMDTGIIMVGERVTTILQDPDQTGKAVWEGLPIELMNRKMVEQTQLMVAARAEVLQQKEIDRIMEELVPNRLQVLLRNPQMVQ
jgi:hypothetical protein